MIFGRKKKKKKLFITGTSRSGTSVFADFLRSNNTIMMGREKYAFRFQNAEFTENLFSKERFCRGFDVMDSHHKNTHPYYENCYEYFDKSTYVGDKDPNICANFAYLFSVFPDCKVICMIRSLGDVAASFQVRCNNVNELNKNGLYDPYRMWPLDRDYRRALEEWNLSLEETLRFFGKQFFIVDYDKLFIDRCLIKKLYDFLEINVNKEMEICWDSKKKERLEIEKTRKEILTIEAKTYLNRNGKFNLLNELLEKANY